MGMAFANLHLYGVNEEDVRRVMAEGDVLRTINAPWLAVLPPEEELRSAGKRFEKTAKLLTKENPEALAIVFYYSDDDLMSLWLYMSGRMKKSIFSYQPWTYLGKLLGEKYDSELPAKAFRLVNQCLDQDEKLELMEQTIGTALYDMAWEPPRRVERSTEKMEALKLRASQARRCKNRIELFEVQKNGWPEYARTCAELAEMVTKQESFLYCDLMMEPVNRRFEIPHQPYRVAGFKWNRTRGKEMFLYNSRTKQLRRFETETGYERVVWVTPEEEPVVFAFGDQSGMMNRVLCLNADGSVKWTFAQADEDGSIYAHHVSENGILTMTVCSIQGSCDRIWRIDLLSGRVLCEGRLPLHAGTGGLLYAELTDRWVCTDVAGNALILLDADLRETDRITFEDMPVNVNAFRTGFCRYAEGVLWSAYPDGGKLYGIDLRNRQLKSVELNTPRVIIDAVFPDGMMMGISSYSRHISFFDETGQLISRNSVDGMLKAERMPDGSPCIVEVTGRGSSAEITHQVLDALKIRVRKIVRL